MCTGIQWEWAAQGLSERQPARLSSAKCSTWLIMNHSWVSIPKNTRKSICERWAVLLRLKAPCVLDRAPSYWPLSGFQIFGATETDVERLRLASIQEYDWDKLDEMVRFCSWWLIAHFFLSDTVSPCACVFIQASDDKDKPTVSTDWWTMFENHLKLIARVLAIITWVYPKVADNIMLLHACFKLILILTRVTQVL